MIMTKLLPFIEIFYCYRASVFKKNILLAVPIHGMKLLSCQNSLDK